MRRGIGGLGGGDQGRVQGMMAALGAGPVATAQPRHNLPHQRPRLVGVVEQGPHHLVHRDMRVRVVRSEEHTSELQSLMRISYAVFCLKKKQETTYNI